LVHVVVKGGYAPLVHGGVKGGYAPLVHGGVKGGYAPLNIMVCIIYNIIARHVVECY